MLDPRTWGPTWDYTPTGETHNISYFPENLLFLLAMGVLSWHQFVEHMQVLSREFSVLLPIALV